MTKEVKNPPQLTEFEEHFVDLYIMNWTAFYYILRTKYAGPKEFAEKLILKTAKSKSETAENFLFMYGYREPRGVYSPTELNKILKEILEYFNTIHLILRYICAQAL